MKKLSPIDAELADLLREQGGMCITTMAKQLQITATAVRQRLARLTEHGYVERKAVSEGRGRPSHRYMLTAKGRQQAGGNFVDLAFALWDEVRSISNLEIRRGLLQRLARRLATGYATEIRGETLSQKMESIANLFGSREVPFTVDSAGALPVLTAKCCPYPELAEQDRGVCAMERMMFSEMLGQNLHLSECRLDGARCCTFEVS